MTEVTTKQAKQMRAGIDITGKVTGLEEPRTVNLKTGGTVDCRNVTLSDAEGSIVLTLWGDDINKVKEGSTVSIYNGYTNEFKGNVSLTKGKYGKMEVV